MTVDYLQARIGLDTAPFKQGMNDAVSSAKRGATEIGMAYITGGRAAQAAMQSLSITTAAMGVASGGLAGTLTGTFRVGADSIGEMGRRAAESGTHVSSLTDQLSAMPLPIAKVIDGLAAWDAAKTVWREFNAALEDTEVRLRRLQQISDMSKQLGTSTTFLTSLAGQAKEYRVEMETLTTMLERAREATRVRLGEGKDAVNEDAFSARLRRQVSAGNLTTADVAPYNAARDQESQIRAALDLIEKLRAANRDLAANDVGRAFFGADFETKTRQGIDLVTAFRNALDGARAAGSGLAPTAEEIARADEFRQREEAIAAVIRDAIAPAVRDFNELSDYGRRTWLDWQERVAGWVKWLGEGYIKIREIAGEVKRMAQSWGLIAEDTGTPEGGPLAIRVKPRTAPRVDRSNPLPALGTARTAKDPIDPDSVASVIRGLEKARDVAAAELKTVEMTNVERARAVALAKAEAAAREDVEKGNRTSAALTDAERNRVIEAADATGRFKDQQKDLEQQLKASADTARYFGDALANAIGDAVLEGKNLHEIFGSLQKMLTRGALQALLSGTGPLANFLGTAPAASAGSDAVGGLAGGLRTLLGGGGSPFSSLFSTTAAAAGSPTGGVRLFDDGGWTGPGHRKKPAGIVHAGEVVWSQDDVRRAGGVQNVEAMRLSGLPGYDRGGVVDAAASTLGLTAVASARDAGNAAHQASATSEPAVKLVINEAPGGDKVGAQQVRRGQDGSLEVVADMLERRSAEKLSRNRGPLTNALAVRDKLRGA